MPRGTRVTKAAAASAAAAAAAAARLTTGTASIDPRAEVEAAIKGWSAPTSYKKMPLEAARKPLGLLREIGLRHAAAGHVTAMKAVVKAMQVRFKENTDSQTLASLANVHVFAPIMLPTMAMATAADVVGAIDVLLSMGSSASTSPSREAHKPGLDALHTALSRYEDEPSLVQAVLMWVQRLLALCAHSWQAAQLLDRPLLLALIGRLTAKLDLTSLTARHFRLACEVLSKLNDFGGQVAPQAVLRGFPMESAVSFLTRGLGVASAGLPAHMEPATRCAKLLDVLLRTAGGLPLVVASAAAETLTSCLASAAPPAVAPLDRATRSFGEICVACLATLWSSSAHGQVLVDAQAAAAVPPLCRIAVSLRGGSLFCRVLMALMAAGARQPLVWREVAAQPSFPGALVRAACLTTNVAGAASAGVPSFSSSKSMQSWLPVMLHVIFALLQHADAALLFAQLPAVAPVISDADSGSGAADLLKFLCSAADCAAKVEHRTMAVSTAVTLLQSLRSLRRGSTRAPDGVMEGCRYACRTFLHGFMKCPPEVAASTQAQTHALAEQVLLLWTETFPAARDVVVLGAAAALDCCRWLVAELQRLLDAGIAGSAFSAASSPPISIKNAEHACRGIADLLCYTPMSVDSAEGTVFPVVDTLLDCLTLLGGTDDTIAAHAARGLHAVVKRADRLVAFIPRREETILCLAWLVQSRTGQPSVVRPALGALAMLLDADGPVSEATHDALLAALPATAVWLRSFPADAACLSSVAAAAARSGAIAKEAARLLLLPALLHHLGACSSTGLYHTVPSASFVAGVAAIMRADETVAQCVLAADDAAAAAAALQAVVAILGSVARCIVSEGAGHRLACPRACADSVLLAPHLVVAALRALSLRSATSLPQMHAASAPSGAVEVDSVDGEGDADDDDDIASVATVCAASPVRRPASMRIDGAAVTAAAERAAAAAALDQGLGRSSVLAAATSDASLDENVGFKRKHFVSASTALGLAGSAADADHEDAVQATAAAGPVPKKPMLRHISEHEHESEPPFDEACANEIGSLRAASTAVLSGVPALLVRLRSSLSLFLLTHADEHRTLVSKVAVQGVFGSPADPFASAVEAAATVTHLHVDAARAALRLLADPQACGAGSHAASVPALASVVQRFAQWSTTGFAMPDCTAFVPPSSAAALSSSLSSSSVAAAVLRQCDCSQCLVASMFDCSSSINLLALDSEPAGAGAASAPSSLQHLARHATAAVIMLRCARESLCSTAAVHRPSCAAVPEAGVYSAIAASAAAASGVASAGSDTALSAPADDVAVVPCECIGLERIFFDCLAAATLCNLATAAPPEMDVGGVVGRALAAGGAAELLAEVSGTLPVPMLRHVARGAAALLGVQEWVGDLPLQPDLLLRLQGPIDSSSTGTSIVGAGAGAGAGESSSGSAFTLLSASSSMHASTGSAAMSADIDDADVRSVRSRGAAPALRALGAIAARLHKPTGSFRTFAARVAGKQLPSTLCFGGAGVEAATLAAGVASRALLGALCCALPGCREVLADGTVILALLCAAADERRRVVASAAREAAAQLARGRVSALKRLAGDSCFGFQSIEGRRFDDDCIERNATRHVEADYEYRGARALALKHGRDEGYRSEAGAAAFDKYQCAVARRDATVPGDEASRAAMRMCLRDGPSEVLSSLEDAVASSLAVALTRFEQSVVAPILQLAAAAWRYMSSTGRFVVCARLSERRVAALISSSCWPDAEALALLSAVCCPTDGCTDEDTLLASHMLKKAVAEWRLLPRIAAVYARANRTGSGGIVGAASEVDRSSGAGAVAGSGSSHGTGQRATAEAADAPHSYGNALRLLAAVVDFGKIERERYVRDFLAQQPSRPSALATAIQPIAEAARLAAAGAIGRIPGCTDGVLDVLRWTDEDSLRWLDGRPAAATAGPPREEARAACSVSTSALVQLLRCVSLDAMHPNRRTNLLAHADLLKVVMPPLLAEVPRAWLDPHAVQRAKWGPKGKHYRPVRRTGVRIYWDIEEGDVYECVSEFDYDSETSCGTESGDEAGVPADDVQDREDERIFNDDADGDHDGPAAGRRMRTALARMCSDICSALQPTHGGSNADFVEALLPALLRASDRRVRLYARTAAPAVTLSTLSVCSQLLAAHPFSTAICSAAVQLIAVCVQRYPRSLPSDAPMHAPLIAAVAAGRRFIGERGIAEQLTAMMLTALQRQRRCRLVLPAAGACEWLSDALFACEADAAAEGNMPVLLQIADGLTQGRVSEEVRAAMMSSGTAGSLMRIASTTTSSDSQRAAAAVLRRLQPSSYSPDCMRSLFRQYCEEAAVGVGVHSAMLSLALAARAATWRRRRHAVVAWAQPF